MLFTHTVCIFLSFSFQILLIDSEQRFLISCGSVHQGICETRELHNISDVTPYYGQSEYDAQHYAVAANDQNSSTVAFIAPGPRAYRVMYVGTTYNGLLNYDAVLREKVG